jgi:hypothetical protein
MRGERFWIAYYLNGRLIQKSLRTAIERVARDKKRKIEYELAVGDLQVVSKLPLPVTSRPVGEPVPPIGNPLPLRGRMALGRPFRADPRALPLCPTKRRSTKSHASCRPPTIPVRPMRNSF